MAGTTGQRPAQKRDQPQSKARSRGEISRTIAILVLALAVILFAVKNLKQVHVDWIVGSGNAPLIIVILITLLVGFVISHLAGRLSRRKRAKDGS
ncbi:MAG TPA: lipopolysaccharide assembly protein LapA domain-containing protein [Solirubrobacteraceae bacterium]|nr:lipopolysaccharide assembly protein LapA domain-containing protein [Solirubrobacteraceae bacterium]